MNAIEKVLRGGALAAAIIAGIALLTMMVLITIEVIQRNFFGRSFLFVEEYSGYMVLVVLAFGVPLALMDNALLRVDLLIDMVKGARRNALQVVYDVASLAFCLTAAYYFSVFAYKSFMRGSFAPSPMMTPLYIPQSFIAIGFVTLSVCLAWRVMGGLLGKTSSEPSGHDGSSVI